MELSSGMRILLVDDNAACAGRLAGVLNLLGHQVFSAARVKEAAALFAQEGEPDLAMVRLSLGGELSGLEIAAQLQRRWQIPVLFVAGEESGTELAGQVDQLPHAVVVDECASPLALQSALKTAYSLFAAQKAAAAPPPSAARLEESERLLREAERVAHLGHYEIDIHSGNSTWAEEVYRIFGLDPKGPALSIGVFQKHIHPDDAELVYRLSVECVRDHRPYEVDFRIITETGEVRHVHSVALIQYAPDGTPQRMFGTLLDVTRSKKVEEDVRRLLQEKEILMREIHHRIKNNLFTITTLLALQADDMRDSAAAAALNDARGRIVSMMAIYDRLYRSQDFRQVNLKQYLSALVDDISATWSGLIGNMTLQVNLEEITVESNLALSLGIILNELLTNACKYAFPRGRAGAVNVQLRRAGERRLVLTVADNGVGIPAEVDLEHPATFGLNLVRLLSEQLQAKMEISHKGGTSFQFSVAY